MNLDLSSSFLALALLGAFHGINPGMGWLFAVALGLQERKTSAVWRSLGPLALGHALAVVVAILVAYVVGRIVPVEYLKWAIAAVLLSFGVYRLFRASHPRYGGMRVNGRQLTIWSFLMASAHGAGLMVLPFIFGATTTPVVVADPAPLTQPAEVHAHHHHPPKPAVHSENGERGRVLNVDHSARHDGHLATRAVDGAGQTDHAAHAAGILSEMPSQPMIGLLAALVHTLAYLLITGILALVVYAKLGLRLLRSAWINLDLIWAGALIATAVLTALL